MKPTLVAFCLLMVLVAPALAQGPTADEVNAVAKHLNCPTCDTRSLDACDTVTCIQWKDQIRDMMVEGYTEAEILDWYVARYGDYVLQEPPTRGWGLVAWLLPIFGFVAAVVWLGFIMKSWSAKRSLAVESAARVTANGAEPDRYLSQVEQDLQNQR